MVCGPTTTQIHKLSYSFQVVAKFEYKKNLSRKLIWKCRLQKVRQIIQA